MRFIRHALLALLLLLAQAGAIAHGVKHLPEPFHGHEPACDLCMAYASMGAGVASTPPVWSPPALEIAFDAVLPTTPATQLRPSYRSRAPPRA